MKYQIFKKEFIEEFQRYLPAEYAGWKLEISEVMKVNGYREAICMLPPNGEGGSPTLYLNELFAYYECCEDMEATCKKAAAIFVMGMDYLAKMDVKKIGDLPKNRIIFVLIPQEGNERMLSNCPHRKTLDLAVVYRILIHAEDDGFDSTIITDDVAEEMQLTEEELYRIAMENASEILPPIAKNTEDVFYLISNEKRLFGAAAMLYPGLLASVAERADADLFILPASLHEVFAVPVREQKVIDMNRMIRDVNQSTEGRDDILANHVYYYSRESDQVTIPEEEYRI